MGKLRRSFVKEDVLSNRWSGGRLVRINNTHFASINELDVSVIDVSSGKTFFELKAEEESDDKVFSVAVDSLLRYAITSHESQLLRLWICQNEKWTVASQWKCPGKFPASILMDPDGKYIAAATSGGYVYFFLFAKQSLESKFEIAKGQITSMEYDANGNLWIGDSFGHISVVNRSKKQVKLLSEDMCHRQRVTKIISIHPYVITSGLDEVVMVFNSDLEFAKPPIAVMYEIFDMVSDVQNRDHVYVATPKGIKRVDIKLVAIKHMNDENASQLFMFDRLYSFNDDGILKSVFISDDQPPNSVILTLHSVNDVTYDESLGAMAVATSSNSILVLKGGVSGTLNGHTNTPVCLCSRNGLLLSGSKDSTARLWSLVNFSFLCSFVGHSEAVTAVSFVPNNDTIITASDDHTIKLWRPLEGQNTMTSAIISISEHTLSITSLDVSIDGRFMVSASRDKTAKLWEIDGDKIKKRNTLSGHNGPIWSVAFSPVDKIVATCGRDKSVKIWSVENGSNVSSFTEFDSPVMRLKFVANGVQLVTAEKDGTIKVIRTKTGAVDFTSSDSHSGNVWGLSGDSDGEKIITGGEDGKVIIWKDNTKELEDEELQAKARMAEADQELKNAIRNGDYLQALRIALKLRLPNQLRMLIRDISEKGLFSIIEEHIAEIEDPNDFEQWMEYVAKWSTNSKWADDATAVISAMLRVKPISYFLENKKKFLSRIDAIIPYLERHMGRLDRLNIQSYTVDQIVDSFLLE